MTPEQFWNHVDKSQGPNACWNWQKSVNPSTGYGAVRLGGPVLGTHRAAFTLANGAPPEPGSYVCHTCDNRLCCNPAHLFEAPPLANTEDMMSKQRHKMFGRTHCQSGLHLWTSENKMPIAGTKWFRCRPCHRINSAKQQAKRRARLKSKGEQRDI